jgi:hypothetical protein
MSTRDVERQLSAVLHRHAETAMIQTDTHEQHQQLQAGAAARAHRDRRGRAVGGAVAAAAVAVGVVWWSANLGEDQAQSGPAAPASLHGAEEVAQRFVEAFAAGDERAAASYVAAGATPWKGWRNDMHQRGAWAPAYFLQSCEEQFTSDAGTRVLCPFAYHILRSEELGLEPFGGSSVFNVLVAEDKVVSAAVFFDYEDSGQGELYEAILGWIEDNHQRAWVFMNSEDHTPAQQRREDELFEQYTREYVEANAP